jgi:hypothetical protein
MFNGLLIVYRNNFDIVYICVSQEHPNNPAFYLTALIFHHKLTTLKQLASLIVAYIDI